MNLIDTLPIEANFNFLLLYHRIVLLSHNKKCRVHKMQNQNKVQSMKFNHYEGSSAIEPYIRRTGGNIQRTNCSGAPQNSEVSMEGAALDEESRFLSSHSTHLQKCHWTASSSQPTKARRMSRSFAHDISSSLADLLHILHILHLLQIYVNKFSSRYLRVESTRAVFTRRRSRTSITSRKSSKST